MIPGRASAALIPNFPSSDAKASSFDLTHSFRSFSSLGGGPPDAAAPPPGNASTSTPMAIPIAVSMEAIVIPCSLNNVVIFSPNEESLSNTLAIVSLKLIIWDFSLPFRRLIDSCLVASSSFRASIRFVMSSLIASSYSPGYFWNSSSFRRSFLICSSNSSFFATSTFSEPQVLLSCLSKPRSSCKGYSNKSSVCDCWSFKCEIKSSMLFVAFSAISWSSMSSAPVMSDSEVALLGFCSALLPAELLIYP